METMLQLLLTYLNPVTWINAIFDVIIDSAFTVLQLLLDTAALLLGAINWLCPVFPNLHPPQVVLDMIKHMAWIIPWSYAVQMLTVMIGCTMFAVMTTWTLRWLKVIR